MNEGINDFNSSNVKVKGSSKIFFDFLALKEPGI